MRQIRTRARWLWLVVAVLAAGCGQEHADRESEAASPDVEQTRAIMGDIYRALRVALPASADPETFSAASARPQVQQAIDQLAAHANELQSHTRPKDAQMRFLARSISRDAREVQRAYAAGRDERAAFLLRQITENCVACHTRLPSDDSPLAKGFLDTGSLERLPPESRAGLQMATRRFDDAIATLEAYLADPDEHPAMLVQPLTDYLVLCLRVKDDYQRPIPTLRKFAAHTHQWERLQRDVQSWIEALPGLRKRTRGKPKLETARELVGEAEERRRLGGELSGLVQLVAASSVLERYIAQHQGAPPGSEGAHRLGQAYYLLGIVEARIGRNYWVSEAPFLLERAIRMAPKEPYALEAYRRLEKEVLMQYEGSDQEEIDPEERRQLDELKALITNG